MPCFQSLTDLKVGDVDLVLCPGYEGGQLLAAEHPQPVQTYYISQPVPGHKLLLLTQFTVDHNFSPEGIALFLDLLVELVVSHEVDVLDSVLVSDGYLVPFRFEQNNFVLTEVVHGNREV